MRFLNIISFTAVIFQLNTFYSRNRSRLSRRRNPIGIGCVVAGSSFAVAQSLGAVGAFSAMGVGGFRLFLGVLVGYGIYRLVRHLREKKRR